MEYIFLENIGAIVMIIGFFSLPILLVSKYYIKLKGSLLLSIICLVSGYIFHLTIRDYTLPKKFEENKSIYCKNKDGRGIVVSKENLWTYDNGKFIKEDKYFDIDDCK